MTDMSPAYVKQVFTNARALLMLTSDKDFDPRQPRDEHGRWSEVPGSGSAPQGRWSGGTVKPPSHAEVAEQALSSSPIESSKTLNPGEHVNSAYKVHLQGDGDAVVKPASGANPKGAHHPSIPFNRDPQAEKAAYQVAKRLGVDTPVVVTRDDVNIDGNNVGFSSVQEFRKFDDGEIIGTPIYQIMSSPEAKRAAIMDVLIGNLDRHQGQIGVTPEGKLIVFDHGFAFPDHIVSDRYEWKNDCIADRFYGEELNSEEHQAVSSLNTPEMEKELKDSGLGGKEITLFKERVQNMLRTDTIESTEDLDERSHTYDEIARDGNDAQDRWDTKFDSGDYGDSGYGYDIFASMPDEDANYWDICNLAVQGYNASQISMDIGLPISVVRRVMQENGY